MSIYGKVINKLTGGATSSSSELQNPPSQRSQEKLPLKSPAQSPEKKPSLLRPESAKTADSSQGSAIKKGVSGPVTDPSVKAKNDDF